tara:strand:+ start:142 stop:327 length:186 start_codon:yes stop_codon:yes gene_type:complete
MGLAESIIRLKEVSKKLRDPNLTDDEIVKYFTELHKIIDELEVPEMINIKDLIGESNEYIS